jgi:hypothetical protein
MNLTEAQRYWEKELVKATDAYERWREENYAGNWGSGFSIVSKNVEKIVSEALKALQGAPTRFAEPARFSAYMKAQLEGIYSLIDEKAPNILDPFKETFEDVKETAASVAKPAAFGAGMALVLLGAAYLLWKR